MSVHADIKRITVPQLMAYKGQKKIVSLTSYIAPFARIIDEYVDMILIGDSTAMVGYNMDDTLSITTDQLSAHAKAVVSSTQRACIVVDMPFGSYQESPEQAFRNAAKMLSDYGLDHIRPENMHISILEAGPRILPALSDKLATTAHKELLKLGVKVRLGAQVKEVTADGFITADGTLIPATLKVWAAGVRAPQFLSELDGLESNRINQLVVSTTLQTTRDPDIFAMGDCAACPLEPGSERNVPPRAQSAHQQAELLARSLALRLQGKPLPHYRYRDYGSLISLSSFTAVGNLMGGFMHNVNLEGWTARMFYISLYRMHQMVLYGRFRTLLLMLSDRIGKRTHPKMKLH